MRKSNLGLTTDDQSLYDDRIKLWDEFNVAWLGLFQQQKTMMESGQQLQRGQSLITHENLEKMAKELIRLCDSIDKYGLVDYQYGVAEERIALGMVIWNPCLSHNTAQRLTWVASSNCGLHEPLRQQRRGSLWERCWFKFSLRGQVHPPFGQLRNRLRYHDPSVPASVISSISLDRTASLGLGCRLIGRMASSGMVT